MGDEALACQVLSDDHANALQTGRPPIIRFIIPEQFAWEQKLIDDYYDYRYRQVLDPLYEQMRQWETGELRHYDIDRAIHATHKKNQELYSLFTNQRDFLVRLIQMDRDWFEPWLVEHPAPEGVALVWPF